MLPLPLEVRAALACGALAVVLGAALWVRHHERAAGAAQCSAEVASATVKAQAAALTETQRRIDAAEGVAHAADQAASAARADAARVSGSAQRLLDRARRTCPTSGDPAAAGPGPAASAAELVPAELLGRALQTAGELADAADRARIAGTACERAYESLKP